jgi:hypothetical protein
VSLLRSWTAPGTPADPHLPDLAAPEAPSEAPVATSETATATAVAEPLTTSAPHAPTTPAPTTRVRPASLPPAATSRRGSRAQRRAAQKAEEQRKRRDILRRALIIGLPILAVLALIAAATTLVTGNDAATGDPAADGRTQRTLLVQVTGNGGLAVGTVLLGRPTDGSTNVTGLLIPSRLLTEAPGVGSVTVGETGRLPDAATAGSALSDQLGVIVDGVWRLNSDGLASLVDAAGGVTVAVDRDVMDSEGRIVVAAGPGQRLDGLAASRYATYLAAGEQEQSRSARFGDVLTAWLAASPEDASALNQIVVRPGKDAAATLPSSDLADFFVPLAVAARGDGLGLSSVPVKPIDTGADALSYRLDRAAVAESIDARFAGSKPAERPGGEIKVLVQNGVGAPGLGQAARDRLVAAGMVFIGGGNANRFGQERSVVIVPDDTSASRERGAQVARALGLSTEAVRLASQGQSVADVVVVLGQDFSAS